MAREMGGRACSILYRSEAILFLFPRNVTRNGSPDQSPSRPTMRQGSSGRGFPEGKIHFSRELWSLFFWPDSIFLWLARPWAGGNVLFGRRSWVLPGGVPRYS